MSVEVAGKKINTNSQLSTNIQLSLTKNDARFRQIIGRHLNSDYIANQNTNVFHAHFTAKMGKYN